MNKIIQKIIEDINKVIQCYYEIVPDDTIMPYSVIPPININFLDESCKIFYLDIEVYSSKYSSEVIIEDVVEEIIKAINKKNYILENIGFHINIEDVNNIPEQEKNITARKITCIVKVMEGGKTL